MAANVETMFYVRQVPWHGIGTKVEEAPSSKDAIRLAGLDWKVLQEDVYTFDQQPIPGYRANIRSSDACCLGIVSDKYKVVENEDAFKFTDELLGEGVVYETAGSLQNGKRVWILARMPEKYMIAGDEITPYFVLMNSHDGSCCVKSAMTPIRVVCQNTLNLAMKQAKRTWSCKHTENVHSRIHEARQTLLMANTYMMELGKEIDSLSRIRMTDKKVMEYMNEFFPVTVDMSDQQQKNAKRMLEDLKMRYFEAPDLKDTGKNGYRFINAISDFATHASPLRKTQNYQENLFLKTVEGNPMIDKAYQMLVA